MYSWQCRQTHLSSIVVQGGKADMFTIFDNTCHTLHDMCSCLTCTCLEIIISFNNLVNNTYIAVLFCCTCIWLCLYSGPDTFKMLNVLTDNIFVTYSGRTSQHTIGIWMGIRHCNCAPPLNLNCTTNEMTPYCKFPSHL